jgi:dTDP-4-amino-4,6-dideoxygalactose transaminase
MTHTAIDLVDVTEDTGCLHLPLASPPYESAGMVPVHLFGHPAMSMTAPGIIIEDCCEALGASIDGQKVGSFGDAGCFSFFPTKNITVGEGGMITTNDETLAENCRLLVAHGIDRSKMDPKYFWRRDASIAGMNLRMSDILAAIGVEQMKRVDTMNARRREIAARYADGFRGVDEITLPVERPGCVHVYQMEVIRVPAAIRDNMVWALRDKGVGASVHFDPPVHRQKAWDTGLSLPVTEKWAATALTIPMYPDLTDADVDYVVAAVKDVLAHAPLNFSTS